VPGSSARYDYVLVRPLAPARLWRLSLWYLVDVELFIYYSTSTSSRFKASVVHFASTMSSSSLLHDAEPLDQPLLLNSDNFSQTDDSTSSVSYSLRRYLRALLPSSSTHRHFYSLRARWIILLFSCVTLAGNYYS
jgi:hypothetical protein